jgi:4-hydroxy-tetrahydrodipicolinate synthase
MTDERVTRLRGMLTAILTPIDLHGDLALEHFPALLDFQRQAGIDGVIVCGTNGEGTSLSLSERKQALEAVLPHRGELTLIAGTGAACVIDAIELTRHAAQAGADAALALPPFFYKNTSVQGMADYFHAVLDAADIPVLLYNIPQHSAVTITDELLALLDGHPNLAGIKDSSGDWNSTCGYITRHPGLRIFSGSDRLVCSCLEAQGAGAISGGANAFPEVIAAVGRANREQPNTQAAQEAQERLHALIDITSRYPFIANSKSILAHRGLPRLGVRPPLVSLTSAQEASLIAELKEAGFLL